jgi:hypothetical protein
MGCRGRSPVLGFLLFLTASCASIPKDAVILTGQVSVGIERMQAQTEIIIGVVGDIERAMLDERWEGIYHGAEAQYLQKHQVPSGAALTQDQRNDIAVAASSVREDILAAIASKEKELIQASRDNAAQVIEINTVVERYMLSLEKIEASRQKTKDLLDKITGVPLGSLVGIVEAKLKGSGG